jgi:hypothetical protein
MWTLLTMNIFSQADGTASDRQIHVDLYTDTAQTVGLWRCESAVFTANAGCALLVYPGAGDADLPDLISTRSFPAIRMTEDMTFFWSYANAGLNDSATASYSVLEEYVT